MYITWPRRGERFNTDAFDTVDDVLKWIRSNDRVQLQSIRLWDGRYARSVTRGNNPPSEKTRNTPNLRDLHKYAWPCYVPTGRIDEDEYARRNNLVCWKSQGRSLYFDPNHDYVCVRSEQSDGCWIRNTLDFARTDAGLWYPRTVQLTIAQKDAAGVELSREATVIERLFLKPVPGFPEGMFDAACLPRTIESVPPDEKVWRP